ncbi:NAD(P)H-binding protein [Pseudactinotalea sp.]|uniref:NAD(P)H-binding protein n=1 Tax=Pseudactinotalea sp. TaxID=1926260 RepID=UPI003B3B5CD5
MYAITGVTGHVGGATARTLLEQGVPVRAVVREEAKAARWSHLGAETAVADLGDVDALGAALSGCAGAFLLLPTLPSGSDSEHRRLVESIAGAVEASGVPQVVVLSSWGAELPEGTGPIRWLHDLENRLRRTGATVTAVRACHFQEKVESVLGAVLGEGIFPVFGETADRPIPMVATRDIGEVAAQSLLAPPSGHQIIDLDGAAVTDREVADAVAEVLGRPLQVVTIPREAWDPTLIDAGLSPALAGEIAALTEADERGLLRPTSEHRRTGTTPIADTISRVLEAARVA